jgi:RNA polymerase sigma factor (TIGR02999 family)
LSEVTQLLSELRDGRQSAAGELLPLVYRELRRLAASQLARLRPGQTLQPTALVHEAYIKLVGSGDPGWDGRGHFFAAAAMAMRELIVDAVRRKSAAKRGGGVPPEELHTALAVPGGGPGLDDVLAVDAALKQLEAQHPRKAKVVVMRYFGGLADEEIAAAVGVDVRTVERDWRFARAWLHSVLFASSA